MPDESVTKVSAALALQGGLGQKYLASGLHISMQLWEQEPGVAMPETQYDDETVGYVISGRAELHIEGQMVLLETGDSWVVPGGSCHHYRILEPFTAVVVSSPRRRPMSATRGEANHSHRSACA